MRLADFVAPETIILDMKARTKDEAIQEIVETLAAAGIVEPHEIADTVRCVHRREDMTTTGTGQGIAIPEVVHANMRRTCAAIFFSRDGIDWHSLDGNNVDLIAAFTKVPAVPSDCLTLINLLSTALRSDEFVDRLRQARTTEEVLAVIEAETYDVSPSPPRQLRTDQEKPPE
jgi:mannitol/fructose-specific phosphotransferase system IIA component (Ntr-type)